MRGFLPAGADGDRELGYDSVKLRDEAGSLMSAESLNPELQALMDAALVAARNSYSPYSGFKVGCALQLADGMVVTGTNVENVSYGLTICAERAALARAVAEHGPGIRIAAMAVTNLNDAPSPPCGACRQMLAEFAEPDAPVVFAADDGMTTLPFSALLPLAFNTKVKA
jgi:cytidine deaminase